MTQGDLAAALFPNDDNARHTRKGDISKLENGKVPNPQTRTVTDIAKILGISEQQIDELRRQVQLSPSQQLDNLGVLDRDQLELLAGRFEIDRAVAMTDMELVQRLTLKAEEYRSYREQVEAIDDRVAALGNIKAAARDAADNLDFDAVEELLRHVDLTETEIAAETKVLRAENALLRGRVEKAYTLLDTAAESFRSVHALLPAEKRNSFAILLYNHGLRYGGTGLALSEKMLCDALSAFDETNQPVDWAGTQNNLGLALSNQGSRTGGAAGAELLAQAVTAYRAALRVYTENRHPVNWAATQNNLGIALSDQGERSSGAAGAELLAQAVAACRAALRVRTEDRHPVQWAGTQNNLGTALQEQGERTSGVAGEDLLAQAVAACRAASRVYTENRHPVDWATTQNNLGNALSNQGSRTGGAAGAELLAQAVAAYRAAFRVRTEDRHPVQWATTQNNLGTALSDQGERTGGVAGAELLAQAVTACRAALRVYSEDQHPVQWAMTQFNLADLHLAKADMGDTARADLEQALAHIRLSLRVFIPSMPQDHQDALALRAKIQSALDALPPA